MSSRPTRERTKVDRFVSESSTNTVEIEANGSGTPLGDINAVSRGIVECKNEEVMKHLHHLCFNTSGKKTTRKRTVKTFNGFPVDPDASERDVEEAMERRVERIVNSKKFTVPLVKEVCDVLGQDKTGTKEELAKRIVAFLKEPDATAVAARPASGAGKKRKAEGGAKKGKKSKKSKKASGEKTKRKRTSFIRFSVAMRPALKEEHPDWEFAKFGKETGRLWNALSDEEKAKYSVSDTEDNEDDAADNGAADEEAEEDEEEAEEDEEEVEQENGVSDDEQAKEDEEDEEADNDDEPMPEAEAEAPTVTPDADNQEPLEQQKDEPMQDAPVMQEEQQQPQEEQQQEDVPMPEAPNDATAADPIAAVAAAVVASAPDTDTATAVTAPSTSVDANGGEDHTTNGAPQADAEMAST